MYNNTRRVRRTKKRKLKKRVVFILVPVLVAFFAVATYATYLYIKADSVFSDSYKNDGREKSDLRETIVDPDVDNVSVLIMGVDASDVRNNKDNDDSRTDSLMLATLNKDDKSVKLLSIPRDSYVYVPEVGYETKINHAHAYGGPRATIDTVENLLDIPVDYYVKVNFEAFIDVVNAVDGVTVDVPYEMSEQDSKDKAGAIQLSPGEQVLNGEEALAFARTRKQDNDIERGKRQQEVIKAVMKKAVSMDSILKFDNIIEAVGKNMTTNMTFDEMKSFISYGTSGKNLNIESLTLEGHDYQPGSTYYYQLDEVALEETKQILKNQLDLADNTSTTASEADNSTAETGTTESPTTTSY
ncbi:LytR family transcriptional regulator [Lentibacillus populi]|uniref:LytR family transcriptional regulator n=1 Tax=Lentibacillus populi TaxID=1827502 RepID=A0A9W5X4I4_9BACI|nr:MULTISPECIES: LCP family protein [Bacillaceae]MBT2216751.1 LCP family protein [Virgibacillus dakarensis]GGB32336.1 LytR family transcriptional regulator [Lentibacillus populi]